MRIDYTRAIAEGERELEGLERKLRGERTQVRVRLLRLLRSGQVGSVRAAAPLLGYSQRQLQTWWGLYKRGGLGALIEVKRRTGKPSRLTPEAYSALEERMRAGRIATLRDARAYLAEEWGIEYRSLNGVWVQLRERRARPKTGRRRHSKADPQAQEAFKSGFRGAAGATAIGEGVRVRRG